MRGPGSRRPRAAALLDRAGAYLADSVLTAAIWAGIVLALSGGTVDPSGWSPATATLASMTFLVVPFAYFVALEGAWSTTPGKRLFGLAVAGPDGNRVGWYKATVRNVLRLAWSLGPLGPLFLALDAALVQWTEKDTRVGDHAAGTRVLRTGRSLVA